MLFSCAHSLCPVVCVCVWAVVSPTGMHILCNIMVRLALAAVHSHGYTYSSYVTINKYLKRHKAWYITILNRSTT